MLAAKLVHVVDDDRGFLKGIERLLRAHGLPARTFASAEEFQANADPSAVSCLILDVNLGGISGIMLLHRLAGVGIKLPVVLVTADDSDLTRNAAVEAGCSAYLEKPFSGRELMEAVNHAITPDGVQNA